MHTRLANLNVPAVQRVDDRTIEVIATGLPLRHGSHAIDTMLVSPLTGAAQPRRRSGQYAGATLHTSRQNKERTYPELAGSNRCRLVVLAMEVGGRWSPEAAIFPPAARPNESPGNPRTFAAHRGGFFHRTMVSHPYTRRYASIRSIPAQPVSRQRSQWRWCLPTPRATSHPSTIHLHCPQSTSRAVRGLMGRGFCPFGVCTSGDWPV